MEMEYSPRHSAGGALHLLSPTHPHAAHVDGLSAIKQIRRSLSHSPSKPSRYMLITTKSGAASPTAPMFPVPRSPSGLSRAYPADSTHPDSKTRPPAGRRPGLIRSNSGRTSPQSPLRRALGDGASHANIMPKPSSRRPLPNDHERENMDCSEDFGKSVCEPARFDQPIKIDFSKGGSERLLQPIIKEHASPMKSSPLKRSDGVMNLETASFESPRGNKRRSLHGASLGSDFNVFDLGFDGSQADATEHTEDKDKDSEASLAWTVPTSSPQKRPINLRKSTLQQRAGSGRKSLFGDHPRDSNLSPAFTRARSRISLDGALPLRSPDIDSPLRRSSANDPPTLFPQPGPKLHHSAPKPHPLSHALTPSSSASSVVDESASQSPFASADAVPEPDMPQPRPVLSKSLPVGAMRPPPTRVAAPQDSLGDDNFATPASYRMAKPLPQAFMSTGLISKRNRNVDIPPAALFSSTHMPDTPSKKVAHTQITSTPAPSALGKFTKPMHAFGNPSSPFNGRASRISPESFGKGVSIFGSRVNAPQLTRRGSFLSFDGEDFSNSPTKQLESQSTNDELPPTPTKSTSTNSRRHSRGKNSSLRSSLFGRRASVGPDTFTAPFQRENSPTTEEGGKSRPMTASGTPSPSRSEMSNPITIVEKVEKRSPHTPQESFTPPDPSTLSISAEQRGSLAYSNSFPPATPTGPRSDSLNVSLKYSFAASSGYFANDVDTALTSRFSHITSYGVGEFSQVYRVEKPVAANSSVSTSKVGPGSNVWAVKKSRRPYTGVKDRQRKMREVQILKALCGHEHIVELVDDWETKNHLYIQTEFCENGNLKDFLLQTGFKGRLDDFRIWKIFLELSLGVQSVHAANFIHLDLKPANVFIDWEGVLKIGDFGMASPWPAPPGLDGEGDREYIGPEVLSGRFDRPADVFALGMIMLEIAGNIVLPDNGTSWQRLRAGDMSDLPSLTWSSESSLVRDESGDPIELLNAESQQSISLSKSGAEDDNDHDDDDDDLSFLRPSVIPKVGRSRELVQPPNFMVDAQDPEALDQLVQWMICPDPDRRPSVAQLLTVGGVRWVEQRRRAGATVYEGNWGPADDVLNHGQDVEMVDI